MQLLHFVHPAIYQYCLYNTCISLCRDCALNCSLQQVLTALQQRQLDELSDWLRRMEALVGKDAAANDDAEPLQMRLEKHKVSP